MNEQRFGQASVRVHLPFLYQVLKGVMTHGQSNYNPIKKTLDCTSDGYCLSLFTRVKSNRVPKTITNIKPEEKKKCLFILLRKLYKDIGSVENYQKQTKEARSEKE
jgi:hypothetical protein